MRQRRYLVLSATPLLTLAACTAIAGLDGEFTLDAPDGSPSSTSTSSGDGSSTSSSSGGSDSSTSSSSGGSDGSASSGDGSTTSTTSSSGTMSTTSSSSSSSTSTTSSSGDGGQDATAPQDSGVDTGPPVDAATPTEQLTNRNFTDDCMSSSFWEPNEATVTASAVFKSGPRSCHVCGKGPTNPWSITQTATLKKVAGLKYKFEVYVQADPNDTAAMNATLAGCELKVFDGSGMLLQPAAQGNQFVPGTTWMACNVSLTLTSSSAANGTKIVAIVNGYTAALCFLVDDGSLTTQ